MSEAPKGFTVGTVLERGRCECCSRILPVGERAALWSPTGELYCVTCANECCTDQHDPWPLILLIAVFALAFAAYLIGL